MKKLHDCRKEMEKECFNCKNRFNVWISTSNFDLDREEGIKSHFYQHCPACRIIEKSKKD